MKIVLTGSSSGIGLAIKNKLQTEHEIICLDITDGYDIGDLSIVKHILDADVFINNAYCKVNPEAQCKLFEMVHEDWRQYNNKHIINMGSLSKYYDLEVFKFPEYSSAKKKLSEVHCKALVDVRKNILTHICPGYTDTPMVKNFSVPKMDVEVVADAVKYCIKMGQLGIEIADLTLCQIKDFGEPPRERQ